MITLIWYSGKAKLKNYYHYQWEWWDGKKGLTTKRHKGILLENENVQFLDCGSSYTLIYIYKNSWNCISKRVNFMKIIFQLTWCQNIKDYKTNAYFQEKKLKR